MSSPSPVDSPAVIYPPFNPYNSPYYGTAASTKFNPTMAIIIIVLIGGCFVLGFCSVFLRRCMLGNSSTLPITDRARSWNSKSRGLEVETVNALPIVLYKDLDNKEEHECSVCLADFEADDSLRLLPKCKHVFHLECIDVWFKSHSTCPLCRASLNGTSDVSDTPSDGETVAAGVPTQDSTGTGVVVVEIWEGEAPSRDISEEGVSTMPIQSPQISGEGERDSARIALFRNSESVKRAARDISAQERVTSSAGERRFEKTPSLNNRKPPSTPSNGMPIRRSTSLGADLKSWRNFLIGGEAMQSNGNESTSETHSGAFNPLSSQGPEGQLASRDKSSDLGTSSEKPADRWVTIDLEGGNAPSTTATVQSVEGESSKSSANVGVTERLADRWSLSSLRGVMFPLSRSISDVSAQTRREPV